jgi:hypothetical protein
MAEPSNAHQWLVVWAIRKMTYDGFVPLAWDGALPHFPSAMLGRSPELRNLRPDAVGVDPQSEKAAFCEAKTWNDIETSHTRQQLKLFSSLSSIENSAPCRLYIAVPRSAAPALDRVLVQTGLAGNRNITRLHVPDSLLEVCHACE